MKKILCLFLTLIMLFTVLACTDKGYKPVASTKREMQTVMTFTADGEEYEVRYELYRALFLTYSESYDNGDKNFWNTDAAAVARAEINEKIFDFSADIYATLHHAEKIGLDPFSDDMDEKIAEQIKNSVDGNFELAIEGFDGDYEAYLKALHDMNMNYAVHELLLRYSIAYNDIVNYYVGTADEDAPKPGMENGALEYTRDDVYNFYISDSAVRISVIELDARVGYERIQEIRNKIASFGTTDDALKYAIGNTLAIHSDVWDGVVIGTESLDKAYYKDVILEAFALSEGETSQPIKLQTTGETKFWILYKREKSQEHFDDCYTDIENVYIAQKIGEALADVKSDMRAASETTSVFDALDYSLISMDDK